MATTNPKAPIVSLGLLTPGVSPVDVLGNFTDLRAESVMAHKVVFQAETGNTGVVYVGLSNLVVASQVGILFVIPVPGANNNQPIELKVDDAQHNSVLVNNLRVAGAGAGDKVKVYFTVN